MDVLMWYVLFAVTTSTTAMYELFIPVLRNLEVSAPNNNIIVYKWTCYITFFLFGLLIAPILLPLCLVPSFGERFKDSLLKSLE